ncbi:MAG TPA: HD-GYP domain-containing protein [Gaiellaceae bacterium]|nr:HD-GYP domain-containing protein [Gaiellaceae bacterium]
MGTLLTLFAALAITGSGASGVGATVMALCYLTLLGIAGLACLVRAGRRREERSAWLAIGAGFALWFGGDVLYWTHLSVPAMAEDAAYFGFYAASATGIALLSRGAGCRPAHFVDAGIAIAGLGSIWAWLVWDQVAPSLADADVVLKTAYPIADLILAAAALGFLQASGWRLSSRWLLLSAGFMAVALADSIYLIQIARGTYTEGTLLDLLWPAGAIAVAAAAWLRSPATARVSRVPRSFSFFVAGLAALAAVTVLVIDHFHRVGELTLSVATITVVLGGVRAALTHCRVVEAERSLRHAAARTVQALATAVDARDHYTHSHAADVQDLARVISERLGLAPDRIERIVVAAQLHDVGKIGVSDRVLFKPGPLTAEEFEHMKLHAAHGEQIVRDAGLDDIAPWIRHHHERWDGTGYPDKLRDNQIPEEARILAVADALNAMLTNRSYRPRLSVQHARAEIAACAGSHFDPTVAQLAVALIDEGALAAPTARAA